MYVYRQMDIIDWLPYIKASFERNPVSFQDLAGKSIQEIYNNIRDLDNESVYDGKRLALPDEVWNYRRGDGIEKAILMADFILNHEPVSPLTIKIDKSDVTLEFQNNNYRFKSVKSLKKTIVANGNNYRIE